MNRYKSVYKGNKAGGVEIPFFIEFKVATNYNITNYRVTSPYFCFEIFHTPSCCGGAFIHGFEEVDTWIINEDFSGFDRGEWYSGEAADLCHAFITDTCWWERAPVTPKVPFEEAEANLTISQLLTKSKLIYIDAERFEDSEWFKPDQMATRHEGNGKTGWLRHTSGLQTNKNSDNRILLGEYHTFDSPAHSDVYDDNND